MTTTPSRSAIWPVVIVSIIALLAAITVGLAPGSQMDRLRHSGTRALQVLGINDSLRYHLHTSTGQVALWLKLPGLVAEQYDKAEPHATNAAERSAALAGYGEALSMLEAYQEAEEMLGRATVLDDRNTRARQLLDNLRRSQNR